MKKRIYNQTSLFGPLYAYLVVLSPPDAIKNAITIIKKELNAISAIGERNLHSIAHITLVDKLTDDVLFPETIEELIEGRKSFPITVKGWDYFDHGHSITVYLKVLNPEPIIDLMEDVKSPARSPHISLVKKIPHHTFQSLRPYLETLNYSFNWDCTEVIVLKKLMSEKHLGFKDKITIALAGFNPSTAL
ncbi:2'-5' RNA ligase family protein [Flavobacterium sp. NRK1]|uniref:2'-5' RNA ligase family protein n=1 Tax=Flavobacterium sp. NRK1 TaxID=2954929 RepID=UPI0020920965|nr:2'-5' RNA ligase family protein [Flavobacterium sp. NRK1]MCO6149437.1 2'-5' RNA ligase family protein [Flavobacterium sp. NRK1]